MQNLKRVSYRPMRVLVARIVLLCSVLTITAVTAAPLGIPKVDVNGQPIDVGLLILGHSTSAGGDYPKKLAAALNGTVTDGRNYQVLRAITNGDGGFLWTSRSFSPTNQFYNRVLSTEATHPQYCEDAATQVRWSCRRTKMEYALTGVDPAQGTACQLATTTCAEESVPDVSCTWHDAQGVHTATKTFSQCWQLMDYRMVLIQDTTNRSWPVDDTNGANARPDGLVNALDYIKVSQAINPNAYACKGTRVNPTGVINGFVDWNCDGALTVADSSAVLYSGWLEKLSLDLLTNPVYKVNHVFITQKPIEMARSRNCLTLFPDDAVAGECSMHTRRLPTPARPFDHFYLPTVYWEYRAIETLFAKTGLDLRIHLVTEGNSRRMWNRSAQCYSQGIAPNDWTVPISISGRPSTYISSDDSEIDTGSAPNSSAVGCMVSDHVHHNDNGGWMMADVWYQGLRAYLQ